MRDPVREIEARIREFRRESPFLPIAVVVPSHLLGHWLAHRLFEDTGHLAISFPLLHELAWQVAEAQALAQGLSPVPEHVDLALALASATEAAEAPETPAYLKEAVGKAGFGPAVMRTLEDLGGCRLGPEDLETHAPSSADAERLNLLARTASGFQRRLEKAKLLDRPAIYARAAKALPSQAIGGVILLGFDHPAPAAVDFLEALSRTHPFAVVPEPGPMAFAPRHDRRLHLGRLAVPAMPAEAAGPGPHSSLARIQDHLFERQTSREAKPLDATVQILAAAGESMEAVEIARLVQQAISEGTKPRDIAVLLHDRDRYAAPLASAFDRAGIPAYLVEGEPRIDPAAIGLGLLLDLLGGDLDRRPVLEFLTTARIPWEGLLGKDAEISPANWDRLSAEAGIVSGIDSWKTRLNEARKKREERKFENDRDLRLYDSLNTVIERLHSDTSQFPKEGTWADFLKTTTDLLDAWIERNRLVKERLERVLGPLGRYAPNPTRDAFLARVHELLRTQVYREGSIDDDRVVVSSIRGATGLRFKVVFVPGLVERAFPAVARPDPLLLDEEREGLSKELRTSRDTQENERILFVRAVRAAGERLVLSWPRFDSSSGRERVPSSFLLQAVEAAMGRRVAAAELMSLASPGQTGLGRPHPENPDAAIDRIERDLAIVARGVPGTGRHLLDGDGFVAASIEMEKAAQERTLTEYDGVLALAGDEVEKLALSARHSSATVVQTLSGCPYRYLLERGFRLKPWKEPERVFQLDALSYGSLYHSAAHRLFAWLQEQGLLPVDPKKLPAIEQQLRKIVEEEAQHLLTEGAILNKELLAPAIGSIHSALAELLRRDAKDEEEFVPAQFEQRFEGVEVPLGDGRAISFNGWIDRVDETSGSDKRVRVLDYKTGKCRFKKDEQFRGGRELQLAIYNLAAARLYEKAEVSEAIYYFATPNGKYKQIACPATDEMKETLVRVLKTLDDIARAGVFAPAPEDQTCQYCDVEAVCRNGQKASAERKAGRPPPRRLPAATGHPMTPDRLPADQAVRDRVVRDFDTTFLLEAGAGTGKTTVLVSRILALVRAGRATLDRIVAITFTEKAAGELKLRLRDDIEKAIEKRDGRRRRSASRRRPTTSSGRPSPPSTPSPRRSSASDPFEAGLDPGFSVAAEIAGERILDDAWDAWLEDRHERGPPHPVRAITLRPEDRTTSGKRPARSSTSATSSGCRGEGAALRRRQPAPEDAEAAVGPCSRSSQSCTDHDDDAYQQIARPRGLPRPRRPPDGLDLERFLRELYVDARKGQQGNWKPKEACAQREGRAQGREGRPGSLRRRPRTPTSPGPSATASGAS